MPYVIRPKLRKSLVGAVASAVFFASIALPAAAEAACPTTPTSKPFRLFGDTADYSLVSNGHFESGTSGWSLENAQVRGENEDYWVRSFFDWKSLRIRANGKAVSPAFCVGKEHPTFRFFARRLNGPSGALNVKLRWMGDDGMTRELLSGSPSGDLYWFWEPSDPLVLASALELEDDERTMSVQLVFDPADGGGDWLIDDVYIDPYRR